ncbi:MAG: thermonuclease family protein [Nitrospinae bacterium]|nr:thermonuclease family protein [Nitrospinota bacterium]
MVDIYGRRVGYAVLPDGNILNEELLRAGMAWHYRVIPFPSASLERLEYEAWKKHLGLWVAPSPVPPWEFRRESRVPDPPADSERMDYDRIISYGIIGDSKKRVYWWPVCSDYPQQDEGYVIFSNKLSAESLGYQVSPGCKPEE